MSSYKGNKRRDSELYTYWMHSVEILVVHLEVGGGVVKKVSTQTHYSACQNREYGFGNKVATDF